MSASPASSALYATSRSPATRSVMRSRNGSAGLPSSSAYLVPSHSGLGTMAISWSLRGCSSMNGPLPIISPFCHSLWSSRSSMAEGIGMKSWKPAMNGKLA